MTLKSLAIDSPLGAHLRVRLGAKAVLDLAHELLQDADLHRTTSETAFYISSCPVSVTHLIGKFLVPRATLDSDLVLQFPVRSRRQSAVRKRLRESTATRQVSH